MEKLASSTHFLFQLQHSLFPVCAFATFHRNSTESLSHLSSRTRHRRFQPFHAKQDQLWVGEEELQLQLKEAVQEEEEDSYFDDDDSSFLSLSDKPDRNMALLDDYETEELDFDTGPDHRSGQCFALGFFWFILFRSERSFIKYLISLIHSFYMISVKIKWNLPSLERLLEWWRGLIEIDILSN